MISGSEHEINSYIFEKKKKKPMVQLDGLFEFLPSPWSHHQRLAADAKLRLYSPHRTELLGSRVIKSASSRILAADDS